MSNEVSLQKATTYISSVTKTNNWHTHEICVSHSDSLSQITHHISIHIYLIGFKLKRCPISNEIIELLIGLLLDINKYRKIAFFVIYFLSHGEKYMKLITKKRKRSDL